MLLIGLLISEFQIRRPRSDIAKRVIRVFLFGIIKLSLLCLDLFVFYVLKLSLKTFSNGLIVSSKHKI